VRGRENVLAMKLRMGNEMLMKYLIVTTCILGNKMCERKRMNNTPTIEQNVREKCACCRVGRSNVDTTQSRRE
jgi:hypothetical protein